MGELDPRIRIRAPLRCDGIGRLDCAEDAESGVRLAVRWLPLEANGESAVQACQKLPQHPTLPKIRQIGKAGAFSFVAMDFPEGELLAAREGEVLPSPTLLWITAQIADALATIHAQQVFHGEMSAESILLVKPEKAEKAYLWDMPLVIANRLTDRRGEERLMHQLVRTAPYLAPERARGEKPSAAADVYALGAIICIAGGTAKPVAETTLGVVHQVANGAFVPKVPRTLPEPMRSMVERMVSPDAKARPSAREVADLFLPPVASMPTLREMPALMWPPVPEMAMLAPTGPRPSLPPMKSPSSWAAMPAVTAPPAAPTPMMAAPVAPAAKPGPMLVAPPMLKPAAMGVLFNPVAISPQAPVTQLASDAAPTPPAPPRMSAPEMMMVPEPTLPVQVKAAAPVPTAPMAAEPTAPVKVAEPEPTAPVASPPREVRMPAPPMVDAPKPAVVAAPVPAVPAAVTAPVPAHEADVPEAAPDEVVDVTAPALKVQSSVALTENLSVAAELVDQGAKALTEEEARALRRKKVLPFAIGGAALVVVGALASIAISMASQPRVRVVQAPAPVEQVRPAPAVPVAAPAPAENETDGDLLAAPGRAYAKRARRVVKPVAAEPAPAPKSTETQSESDFSFLDDGDAPLKRPAF